MKEYPTFEDDACSKFQEIQIMLERLKHNQISRLKEYLDTDTFEAIKNHVTFFCVYARDSDNLFKYGLNVTLDLRNSNTTKPMCYSSTIKKIEHKNVTDGINKILKRFITGFVENVQTCS